MQVNHKNNSIKKAIQRKKNNLNKYRHIYKVRSSKFDINWIIRKTININKNKIKIIYKLNNYKKKIISKKNKINN